MAEKPKLTSPYDASFAIFADLIMNGETFVTARYGGGRPSVTGRLTMPPRETVLPLYKAEELRGSNFPWVGGRSGYEQEPGFPDMAVRRPVAYEMTTTTVKIENLDFADIEARIMATLAAKEDYFKDLVGRVHDQIVGEAFSYMPGGPTTASPFDPRLTQARLDAGKLATEEWVRGVTGTSPAGFQIKVVASWVYDYAWRRGPRLRNPPTRAEGRKGTRRAWKREHNRNAGLRWRHGPVEPQEVLVNHREGIIYCTEKQSAAIKEAFDVR